MTKGLFKEATKNSAGFWSAVIENTGLQSKYFGTGKFPPKVAAGTWVEFDYSEKEVNGKTYYNVEGKLKESEAPASAPSQSTSSGGSASSNDPRQSSIENQVCLKSAVEFSIGAMAAGETVNIDYVRTVYQQFQDILHPKPAAPKKPKAPPAEPDVGDGDDLPY